MLVHRFGRASCHCPFMRMFFRRSISCSQLYNFNTFHRFYNFSLICHLQQNRSQSIRITNPNTVLQIQVADVLQIGYLQHICLLYESLMTWYTVPLRTLFDGISCFLNILPNTLTRLFDMGIALFFLISSSISAGESHSPSLLPWQAGNIDRTTVLQVKPVQIPGCSPS